MCMCVYLCVHQGVGQMYIVRHFYSGVKLVLIYMRTYVCMRTYTPTRDVVRVLVYVVCCMLHQTHQSFQNLEVLFKTHVHVLDALYVCICMYVCMCVCICEAAVVLCDFT
jgi:hypothetical protein